MEIKFDRDPDELGYFLVIAVESLRDSGHTFPDKASRVSYLGFWFGGAAAKCT